MEYRKMQMPSGTVSPSMLGFGCMRFPKTADGKIDEEKAAAMIDRAIKAGVSYIDTAYPYHDGESEPFVGKVLKNYPRESYFLATKLPVWKVETLEDAQRIFDEQLTRLQEDYVDFYLLHALNRARWDKIKELHLVEWAEGLLKAGKIRHLGFSFHDDYSVFEEIITSRKWDFCQIQYNYMDREIQAGDKGYALAESLGVPIVIMEPVKGGTLAALPQDIEEIFTKADPKRSCASWALRWVGSRPNVKVILSGMSTMEQVENNLETFGTFEPLSESEEQVVAEVAATLKKRVKNGCTGCRYCMPCPFGLDIPENFLVWNEFGMYENADRAKREYLGMDEAERADHCKKCGKCEKECPQKLHIRDDLARVSEELGTLIQK